MFPFHFIIAFGLILKLLHFALCNSPSSTQVAFMNSLNCICRLKHREMKPDICLFSWPQWSSSLPKSHSFGTNDISHYWNCWSHPTCAQPALTARPVQLWTGLLGCQIKLPMHLTASLMNLVPMQFVDCCWLCCCSNSPCVYFTSFHLLKQWAWIHHKRKPTMFVQKWHRFHVLHQDLLMVF